MKAHPTGFTAGSTTQRMPSKNTARWGTRQSRQAWGRADGCCFCEISNLSVMARRQRVSIIAMVVIVVAAVVAFFVSRVRYLSELEPPARYNHPYHGPVDERVMPVAEVRTLCTSVGASGRFVACAWVSDGVCHIVLPNDERAPVSTYRRHEIAHCNGWPENHPHGG